ncbi:DUF4190 domain-containing protein [Plantactinospora sp. S1510]|uniref:DUF4190 domain-containing protein n=1 Tax=Plantactinospora alkalitolerans TaxID=2789879 RepID=A0ABS0GP10_9ACTN|nr:DUF4190 domain-containing protein [Plantactinospora alkalitolerans]MBF9127799.1 DUF4190 domain-containing protein [Plantactinospora alkalitolerans]
MTQATPDTPSEPGGTGLNPYDAEAGQQSAPPVGGPQPTWAPGYPTYQVRRPTNSMAIAAMITGIVALFSCQLIGVVAVYLAKRAREEIQASGEEGAGFATAGLVLGWIAIGLAALSILALLAYFGLIGLIFATSSNTS